MTRMAWGAGLTTEAADGTTLDAWFRWLGWGEFGSDEMVADHPDIDTQLGLRDRVDELRRVKVRPIRLTVDVDEAPASAADVYLRLHLLSHRLAAPRTLNLDGAFGLLSNVAWTNLGPVAVADLDDVRLRVRLDGGWLEVHGLDKFPRMTDYVVPERRPHRRCRPGPARRPLGGRDGRDARGLRELQRWHARHVDGRGSHLTGRRRR